MDKESSKLLDAFFNAGGNLSSSIPAIQHGSSEEIIDEWMEKRNIRDQVVVATKYTDTPLLGAALNHANYLGNNLKSLTLSLEISLNRLRTTYVNVLYVHYSDLRTSVEEMMDGLHNIVQNGSVLYLGISDSLAWFVGKSNAYAKAHRKTPFVIYQGH